MAAAALMAPAGQADGGDRGAGRKQQPAAPLPPTFLQRCTPQEREQLLLPHSPPRRAPAQRGPPATTTAHAHAGDVEHAALRLQLAEAAQREQSLKTQVHTTPAPVSLSA